MNILYFGTVCDLESYELLLKDCSAKPSVAPILFETALLKGFYKNGASVEIHSFPMIPTFPHFRILHFGGNSEKLSCGYSCRWLNTVNIPVLKQLSRRLDARRRMKRWIKRNTGDGVIITYSIPPFMVKDVITYARRYHVKAVAIVTDLLRDMYMNEDSSTWMYKLKNLYLKPALRMQGEYDGYIYLTEAMRDAVAPDKPYIVMEGIADVSNLHPPQPREPSTPRAIMYAGMLYEKYGVINLLDAFQKLDLPSIELWLFGEGDAISEITKRAETDGRIRFFGRVSHDEILSYERKAALLVNPRDADELFTQYSFPSKTIEYMFSGTPLLTTKLKGIPDEYFNYVFTAESNKPDDLADGIRRALMHSEKERTKLGTDAQRFIAERKNAAIQAKRILSFLEEQVKNNDKDQH